MKKLFAFSLSLVMAFSGLTGVTPVQTAVAAEHNYTQDYVEGEAIACIRKPLVSFFAEDPHPLLADAESLMDVTPEASTFGLRNAAYTEELILVKSDTLSTKELIAELEKLDEVVFAEPNYIAQPVPVVDDADMTLDTEYTASELPYLPFLAKNTEFQTTSPPEYETSSPEFTLGDLTPLQWGPDAMNIPDWNTNDGIDCSDSEVVVAVLDTGVDYNHPDLPMWEASEELIKEIGGGKYGYNAAPDAEFDETNPMPWHSHGTHCAGIISAKWNDEGTSGIARNAKIMAVRTNFSTASALKGMQYIKNAKKAGVNVIAVNNSWGDTVMIASKAFDFACTALGEIGIISVFASGNETRDLDYSLDIYKMMYNNPYAVIVNSSASDGALSSFSDRGAYGTDVVAPGSDILSTVPKGEPIYAIIDPSQIAEDQINGFEENEENFLIPNDNTSIEFSDEQSHSGAQSLHISATTSETRKNAELFIDTKIPKNATHIGLWCYADYTEGVSGDECVIFVISKEDPEQYTYAVCDVNTWSAATIALPESESGEFYLFLQNPSVPSEQSFYIDDFTFLSEEYNIPYCFLSGTSMAAPAVVGEAAILAAKFPEDSAAKRAARIIGSVTQSEALKDTCISGGIVDVEKALNENTVPVLNNAYIDENGTLTVEGFFFGEEHNTITLDGTPLEVTAWNDERITAKSPDTLSAQYHVIDVTSTKGSGHQRFMLQIQDGAALYTRLPIPELPADSSIEFTEDTQLSPTYLTEYNNKLYGFFALMDRSNVVFCYTPETREWSLFEEEPLPFNIIQAATTDNGMVVAYAETEFGTGLITYNLRTKEMFVLEAEDVPEEFLASAPFDYCKLADYGDEILFIGEHYREIEDKWETDQSIYKIDPAAKIISKWTELSEPVDDVYMLKATDGNTYLFSRSYAGNIDGFMYYTLYRLDKNGNVTFIGGSQIECAPYPLERFSFSETDDGILATGFCTTDETGSITADTWLINTKDGSCQPCEKLLDRAFASFVTTAVCDGDWYACFHSLDEKDLVFATEPDVLTEPPASSGGNSGGSGGGSSNSKPNASTTTTTNSDGSTTTTTTDQNGTVTETTKHTDGSVTVVETKKDGTIQTTETKIDGTIKEIIKKADGSVKETITTAEGTKAVTEITAEGSKTTTVTLPDRTAESTSSLPISAITVEENSTHTLTINTSADKATVEVPLSGASAGTVAVLVNSDGTETILRDVVADGNFMTLTVTDGTTVKFVDNRKDFADVSSSDWFHDAVAFASSHELFSGTSETTFTPDAPMTRGMLAVVLHNLQHNPESAANSNFADVSNQYFANAVAWAAGEGIISGYGEGQFGPNDSITREQLAVMLYRFAGKPTASGDVPTHSDAAKISSYAVPAMRWAVENGIISGKTDGTLDPQGSATRAEVASMLMRFCKNQ